MRVALLSHNARQHDAIGNMLAARVRFFQERGAKVCLFIEDARRLHPELRPFCTLVAEPTLDGPAWDYLRQADLVLAMYGQTYRLLQWLPCLVGQGPRIILEYPGVTPSIYWSNQQREGVVASEQRRGYVWCADHAIAISTFARRELHKATQFPLDRVATLPPLPLDDRFAPGGDSRYWQRKLGIEGRVLLCVGRFATNKRLPLVIEALAKLEDQSVHAVLVGDQGDVYAAEATRCRTLAQQLGVAARVHLVAPLPDDDLPAAYRGADVLVAPSVHEGFCVPVIEAMACAVPVVASRCTALTETIGDAGLTFTPDDAGDLARQLRRVLAEVRHPTTSDLRHDVRPAAPRRVAVVCFRFGSSIVGGAETSLRRMASALQAAGQHVEVFATCTTTESHWTNDVACGTFSLDGLTVHRFPIDRHDADAHGETFREILENEGRITAEIENRYLDLSIHSSALVEALRKRRSDFDAIIVGPYLFGLTADIVAEFAHQTLLVPCFHDEPLARLAIWPTLFSKVGGILYHSREEQIFAQHDLGVHHPNVTQIGTLLQTVAADAPYRAERPYLVYCGRYSEQKNVPLLLEWLRGWQKSCPHPFDVICMGQGPVALPCEPWLRDLGRVDEATKQAVLAGAAALVQLSTHESLSIVVLEAWTAGTPVIVHRDCPVLVGQIERANGGAAVGDFDAFAEVLADLAKQPEAWRQRGANGQRFVKDSYTSCDAYAKRLFESIDGLQTPLSERMRQRGLTHAASFRPAIWQQQFADLVEEVLTQPARALRTELRIEPLRADCGAGLFPVRITNQGTHAAVPDGPGRIVVCCEADRSRRETALSSLVLPGQSCVMAVALPEPDADVMLWMERKHTAATVSNRLVVPRNADKSSPDACAAVFVNTVQSLLPRVQECAALPGDYVDISEGWFASLKRFIKRKLLNNFKRGYVDVLSRRQSRVNEQLIVMIQQLTECCAMLDHAVVGLHQRLDVLERRMDTAREEATPDSLLHEKRKGLHG